MRRLATFCIRGLFLLLPFLLLVALWSKHTRWFFWFALVLFLLRTTLPLYIADKRLAAVERAVCCIGILICLCCLIRNIHFPLLWYPVAVNALFLIVFVSSLFGTTTIVEFIARMSSRGKPFPPSAVRYTRNVTWCWVVFFVINLSVSTWTVLSGDIYCWTAWNGCISYILMGLLAGGEYLVRRTLCNAQDS